MSLEDKVVVVTGAARGIGFATARLAAERGARVVLCDLEAGPIEEALASLPKSTRDKCSEVVADVSVRAQVEQAVWDVIDRHGRIDVLVNNAATQKTTPATELTEDHWRRELDICLTGTFFWSQAVANASMIANRSGVIVNVGSGASLAAMPNSVSYVAAKHGVLGLTKALAVDWAQYGIRVNCVCPGFTWTDLARSVAQANPEMMEQRVARIPLRAAEPEDPAYAILFLASDEAGAISGASLQIDGGTLALSSGYSAPRVDSA